MLDQYAEAVVEVINVHLLWHTDLADNVNLEIGGSVLTGHRRGVELPRRLPMWPTSRGWPPLARVKFRRLPRHILRPSPTRQAAHARTRGGG